MQNEDDHAVTQQPESVLIGDAMMKRTQHEDTPEEEMRKGDVDSDSDDNVSLSVVEVERGN